MIFRGSDRQIYQWGKANDVVIVRFSRIIFFDPFRTRVVQLSAGSASLAPIAIAYDDVQSFSMVDDAAESFVLCIQPTGFHLLHEIVVTFILFERLYGRPRADYDRKSRSALSPRRGQIVMILLVPVIET